MKILALGIKHNYEVKDLMSRGENNPKNHLLDLLDKLKHIARNRKHTPVKGL